MNDFNGKRKTLKALSIAYVVTMLVLIAMFTFARTAPLLIMMWLVGLGGLAVIIPLLVQVSSVGNRKVLKVQAQLERYRREVKTYQTQIERVLEPSLRRRADAQVEHLRREVRSWAEAAEALIERAEQLRRDALIHKDLEAVPQAIAELEARINDENDEQVRAQLERTLENRRKQLAALDNLQSTVRRTETQIESTVSLLGTMYSQLLTTQSTDNVADYSRLSAEVADEVQTLQDHLDALTEVRLAEQ